MRGMAGINVRFVKAIGCDLIPGRDDENTNAQVSVSTACCVCPSKPRGAYDCGDDTRLTLINDDDIDCTLASKAGQLSPGSALVSPAEYLLHYAKKSSWCGGRYQRFTHLNSPCNHIRKRRFAARSKRADVHLISSHWQKMNPVNLSGISRNCKWLSP